MASLRFWIIINALSLIVAVWLINTLQEDPGVSIYASPTPEPSDPYAGPPGVTPREAITGSSSGSTIGRAENPWDTHGKPKR